MTPEIWTMTKEAIGSFGFPIFVACYLLIFMRATIQANTDAIKELVAYLKARNEQP